MATPEIGQVLGRYRIVELIGSGGMGVVYRAHDEQLHRDVALKVLQAGLLNEAARRQLQREALTAAQVTDANVAMAFDFGRDQGVDYLVTEYVPGVTLNAKIAGRALPEAEVLELGKQMASGLEAAHRQGVIHRDLKPGNMRVTPEGRLKILDFGLAFLVQAERDATASLPITQSYDNAGTLPYMSPEQLEGNKPDERADIWSAGAVLYEMATGVPPFGELKGMRLTDAIRSETPPGPRMRNAKICEGLERVIQRALCRAPGERYQSAGDLRIDLNQLAMGTAPIYATARTPRWAWWVAAAVLAAVLAAGGFWWTRRAGSVANGEDQVMAVLPFEAAGNDASANALGTGLSETLTAKLVQASDGGHLQMVSTRDLVAQGVKTAEQARREFGTDLVLEASMQQFGDRIRINCSLVNSRTHLQMDARTITGTAGDPFALEDELVDKVLEMLPVTVGREKRAELEARADTKPAAYEFYLRGRGYLEDYRTPNNLEHAIEEFGKAVEVDGNYAPARAAMGIGYAAGFKWENRGKDWLDKAQAECERALAIMPQLAEGHTCLGDVYLSRGRYADAVQEFQRSLELNHDNEETLRLLAEAYQRTGNAAPAEHTYQKAIALRPNYYGVYSSLGYFYSGQARYVEAAAVFRKAVQLAPENYRGYANLGGVDLLLGQYDEAVDAFKKSIALRPTSQAYGNLGAALFYLRRYEDSAETLQTALKLDDRNWGDWGNLGDALYQIPSRRAEAPSAYKKAVEILSQRLEVNPKDVSALAMSADYYAMLDQEMEARRHLASALAIEPSDPDVLFRGAILYNHIGDTTKTLEFLRRAVDAGCSRTQVRDTPDFDHLRGDKRLDSFLPPTYSR